MHEYLILDVFTRTPLEGNALAVFLDTDGLDARSMQRTARELNLSETVFLGPGDGDVDASLRIFTPVAELPFAGHPTLGAGFVVGARSGRDQLSLRTGAGTVPLRLRREDGELVYGEMDQPLPAPEPFEQGAAVLRALGIQPPDTPLPGFRNGPWHIYVQLEDAEAVDALEPDLGALAALGQVGINCFALNAHAAHVRMFGPGLGVPEDPATGSAAGPLALHLAETGQLGWGEDLEIHQGVVMGRPSVLHARVEGRPGQVERVVVGGAAVVVAEGRYRLS